MTRGGLPHSDIFGSKLVCSSPKLFAACHVLHRLLAPRHSPYTLSSLTIRNSKLTRTNRCIQLACDSSMQHCFRPPPLLRASARLIPPFGGTRMLWSEKTTVVQNIQLSKIRLPARPAISCGAIGALQSSCFNDLTKSFSKSSPSLLASAGPASSYDAADLVPVCPPSFFRLRRDRPAEP